MRDAVFRRAAPIGLHVRIAALIPEHEFEGDGKSFPSHGSPYFVGGSVCPIGNKKPRRSGASLFSYGITVLLVGFCLFRFDFQGSETKGGGRGNRFNNLLVDLSLNDLTPRECKRLLGRYDRDELERCVNGSCKLWQPVRFFAWEKPNHVHVSAGARGFSLPPSLQCKQRIRPPRWGLHLLQILDQLLQVH
ncbi:hypothetical protein CN074_27485 [Sinorhizobium medicae]|nr:hypothetical protein CN201_13145 [Sinorhizobium medicae]RVP62461.1 hypothetical protein CN074_27485 [Sinorhizobium medicae]